MTFPCLPLTTTSSDTIYVSLTCHVYTSEPSYSENMESKGTLPDYIIALWKKAREISRFMSQQHQALSIPYSALEETLVRKSRFLLCISPYFILGDGEKEKRSRRGELLRKLVEGKSDAISKVDRDHDKDVGSLSSLSSVQELRENISYRPSISEDIEETVQKAILTYVQSDVDDKQFKDLLIESSRYRKL